MLLQQLNMWPHLYIEHTGSYAIGLILKWWGVCVCMFEVLTGYLAISEPCPWQWLRPVMSGMRWKFANNLCHQLLLFCFEAVFVLLLRIWSLIFAVWLGAVRFMFVRTFLCAPLMPVLLGWLGCWWGRQTINEVKALFALRNFCKVNLLPEEVFSLSLGQYWQYSCDTVVITTLNDNIFMHFEA